MVFIKMSEQTGNLEFDFTSPNWEICRIYNEFTTKKNRVVPFLMEMKKGKPSVN